MDKDRKPVKSSKKLAKPWTADVKDLPGSAYFIETDPRKYDFHEYMDFIDARSTDRRRLSSVWHTAILPRLSTSQFQVLRDEGKRLEKEWSTEKATDDMYWSRLKEKELEDEQQRRSMSTLKAQAYERFDAMQDLIVVETKAVTGKFGVAPLTRDDKDKVRLHVDVKSNYIGARAASKISTSERGPSTGFVKQ
ncbi:hypothetical protein BGZ70_008425 [Mortierella alpina]|uniref:Uncharacterized protein n=1 Tax=Mortierella alpina TaxID=64518 RepID=A0A9P6J3K1_MORAP|nr:hypothetical protein BGZ70_008425 [Mortierella alpina]